jgi:DNA-binding response OmpR family regulator
MVPRTSKILLVEDDELVGQLLARVLSDSGYAVEEADNGASALQAAHRLNGSLGLIVADINLPIMDGLEFARALRLTDGKVPFLFVTARMDPGVLDGIRPPAQVLRKPFTPDEFLAAVVDGVGQLA